MPSPASVTAHRENLPSWLSHGSEGLTAGTGWHQLTSHQRPPNRQSGLRREAKRLSWLHSSKPLESRPEHREKLELAPCGGRFWTRDSSGVRVLLFVVERRHLAEGGVASVGIVPGLNEVEHGHPGLGLIAEALTLDEFGLECGEEALAHRVVIGVADGPQRGPDAGLFAA